MSLLSAVLPDYALPYLGRSQLLIFFKSQRQQRLVHANCAMRRVVVLKTAIQTLVTHSLVAMAVAGQLGDRDGYLLNGAIRIASYAGELFGRERWTKRRAARRLVEESRNMLRSGSVRVVMAFLRLRGGPSRRLLRPCSGVLISFC